MTSLDFERTLEDFNNSDDENEADELLYQAFVRPPAMSDDDMSGPPMSGEQYLQRVIEEAKRCKAVVVANVESKRQRNLRLPHFPERKECNSKFLPSKDWQTSTTSDFSRLRLEVEALRKKLSIETVEEIINTLPSKEDDEDFWLLICTQDRSDLRDSPVRPSTKLCLAMPQELIWHFLSLFPAWLTEGALGIQNSCCWIYCLLASLELPITSDIYFTLRQISRALTDYRAKLEDPQSAIKVLPHINLIVCIIGRYFNQVDLADPYLSA